LELTLDRIRELAAQCTGMQGFLIFHSFVCSAAAPATFNTTTAEVAANISAYETRAAGVPWVFAPVVDLGLDVRWSRIWEDFGEDPYLGGQMGAAYVRGFQGDPYNISRYKVAACGKHYVGYGNPISGKDRTPAVIPELYLREYHLPAFQALVEAKVATIMVNSGLINGIPVHSSKFLITDVLKGELKYDGFVVTDWGDIGNMFTRDHAANSTREAVALAINAGIDMAMIPYDLEFTDHVIALYTAGRISIDRINDAVRRILKVKARIGLWQINMTKRSEYPAFGDPAFHKAAKDGALESITLLKNDGDVLPLDVKGKYLLTGPNAGSIRPLLGGWSYSWQGEKSVRSDFGGKYNTIAKAINNSLVTGGGHLTYSPGVEYNYSFDAKYWEEYEVNIQAAANAVAGVDAVILALGENSYTEKPGDLNDLALSPLQVKLAKAIIAAAAVAKKKVVLVLNEGRPRIIDKIEQDIPAIVQIYLPGHFGADALADILFGKVNPSGKLPYTYPRFRHSLINYWHKLAEEQQAQPGPYNYESDYNPLWEFGHGLSYTTFAYSNLVLSKTKFSGTQTVTVNVTVKNTGKRPGKEVVQLYSSDLYASVAPDKKRLRRFTKIELEQGAQKVVTFNLTAADLSFINWQNKRVTEPGEFTIQVGPLVASLFYE
jgi:beta-glucosidase